MSEIKITQIPIEQIGPLLKFYRINPEVGHNAIETLNNRSRLRKPTQCKSANFEGYTAEVQQFIHPLTGNEEKLLVISRANPDGQVSQNENTKIQINLKANT